MRLTRYYLGAALVAVVASGVVGYWQAFDKLSSPARTAAATHVSASLHRVTQHPHGARAAGRPQHEPTLQGVTLGHPTPPAIPVIIRPHPTELARPPHVAASQRVLARHTVGGLGRVSARVAPKVARAQAPTVAPRPEPCPLYASATTISIPRLGVTAPVYDCDTDPNGQLPIAKTRSVTHWYRSAALGAAGNYVVYGHDDIEGSIFASLSSMQAGDRVTFTVGARRVVYVVTGSSIVSPYATSVLDPTPTATLTLISCYPVDDDASRVVVKAALQSN